MVLICDLGMNNSCNRMIRIAFLTKSGILLIDMELKMKIRSVAGIGSVIKNIKE